MAFRTSQAPHQAVGDDSVAKKATSARGIVKYGVEAIGTFLLVFTVGAAVGGRSTLAPLAIGVVLMVMVYAGGRLSGGHYNPAVTLAVLARRRIGLREAAAYWVVQLGAGLLAAVVVRTVIDPAQLAGTAAMTLSGRVLAVAFVAELLFTFALCYVVLNVATSRDRSDDSLYGLVIGFTVVAGALAVGAICGGAFNPDVTVGAAAAHIFAWPTIWVYLVAQVIAGAAAGVAFVALNPGDK